MFKGFHVIICDYMLFLIRNPVKDINYIIVIHTIVRILNIQFFNKLNV